MSHGGTAAQATGQVTPKKVDASLGQELEALPFPDSGTWRKGLSPCGAVPMEMLENSLGEGVRSIRVPWDTPGAVKQASRPHALGFVPTARTWPDRGRQQPTQTQTT